MIGKLAERCAVAVYGDDRFLGSGFFVAPGEVLTCAHVPAGCRDDERVMVRWEGSGLVVHAAVLLPASRDTDAIYPFPDLALLTVDPPSEQPFVWLADQLPATGSAVVCHGFSRHTPEATVARDSALLQVVGASGRYVKIHQGELPHGLSGSLVLDSDTGRVCGLVKATRDADAPRGGWIVPAPVIAEYFEGLAERNLAGHGPGTDWRDLVTRRGEFAQRLFGSRVPLQVPEPPPHVPPSWWLDPRHRVTGFQRRAEADTLLAWAADGDPAAPMVRLVVGPGGSGKTRMAVELAARLGAEGWVAGVVAGDDLDRLPEISRALPEVVAHGHRVFLALDYVEGLGAELTRLLSRLPGPDEGVVRVLLLARFGGAWWNSVTPSGEVKYRIDRAPIELRPLGDDPDDAEEHFTQAVRDYRLRVIGLSSDARLPHGLRGASRRHTDALNLHALALVSVLHERDHGELPEGEVAWKDPLSLLVAHDRKHWQSAGRRLAATADPRLAGRTLLAPTLLPVYDEHEATAAIERIPDLLARHPQDPAAVAQLLRDLYPPQDAAALRWWWPLPLD